MTQPARPAARTLFDQQTSAVLCTAHAGLGGWPFGSVVPYAVLPSGDAVVFLSDIAEHTKNLLRDARASVFVADPAAQARPQAGGRMSILVRARLPVGDEVGVAEAAYFARFPQAAAMRSAHGFDAWLLEVDCVRWIAGFGEMGWIDRATWSGVPDPLAAHAADIIAHMNEDHAAATRELVQHIANLTAARAAITGLDRGGFLVLATDAEGEEHELRLPFPSAAASGDDVRQLVIAMLAQARAPRA
jgi:putative heme iron utilization protein